MYFEFVRHNRHRPNWENGENLMCLHERETCFTFEWISTVVTGKKLEIVQNFHEI